MPMATIILFCVGVSYAIIGAGAFFVTVFSGEFTTALVALFLTPILFWPITLILAMIVFLVMKSRAELRSR